jgi:calcineurin-like phosphoesterase family protein
MGRLIYFTADVHAFHENIIKHVNRPFANAAEMNAALIDNWNQRVQPNDQIYILGDFSFGSSAQTEQILRQLNGKKYLAAGNHDHQLLKDQVLRKYFVDIFELRTFKFPVAGELQKVVCAHYPMKTWDCRHYRSWQLYGHVHSRSHEVTDELQLDVGVDANNYRPISIDEIAEIMKTRAGPKKF